MVSNTSSYHLSCPQVRQHRPALLLRGGADRGGQAADQPRGQQGAGQQGREDRPRDGRARLRQDPQELKISDIYNCELEVDVLFHGVYLRRGFARSAVRIHTWPRHKSGEGRRCKRSARLLPLGKERVSGVITACTNCTLYILLVVLVLQSVQVHLKVVLQSKH